MNYEEEMKRIEADKNKALQEKTSVYDNLLNENQGMYDNHNQQMSDWKKTQEDLINKQVGFQQDQYNQYKADADKDFQQEAKASNIDYQKFTNPYGAEREQQVKSGLANAGVSESIKLGAYNTAQNRTATARATTEKIKADFNTRIQEARLKGDAQMAEIAFQQMQMQLENALRAFDYKSQTTQNKLQMGMGIEDNYYGKIQDVYSRQQQEQQQQEMIRQYNEQMKMQQQQMAYQQQQDKIANSQKWASINASKQPAGGVDFSGDEPIRATGNTSGLSDYTKSWIQWYAPEIKTATDLGNLLTKLPNDKTKEEILRYYGITN